MKVNRKPMLLAQLVFDVNIHYHGIIQICRSIRTSQYRKLIFRTSGFSAPNWDTIVTLNTRRIS
jgi:hypothetical protein